MAFTKSEIDRMTAAEYKEHMADPEFIKSINEVPAAPSARAAAPSGTGSVRDRAQIHERNDAAPISFDPAYDVPPQLPVVQPVEPVAVAPVVEPVAEVPVVAAPAPPAELPEFKVSYQPTDDAGRPVGGLQVIKYRADSEIPESHPLIQQLIKNHVAATVSLRKARTELQLKGTDAPEGASRFPKVPALKVYTPEYRTSLEEQLQDPAKTEEAQRRLEDDDMRRQQNQLQEDNFNTQALLALEQFKNDNPDFYKCQENADSIVAWVSGRGLDPRDKNNFQRAYNALKEVSAIVARPNSTNNTQPPVPELVPATPSVREVETRVNTQPVQEQPARIGQEVPAQVTRPVALIPTGLTRNDSSEGEPMAPSLDDQLTLIQELKDSQGKPTGVKKTFKGLAALDRLSGDEYGRRVKEDERFNTGFRTLVDKLEATRKSRPASR